MIKIKAERAVSLLARVRGLMFVKNIKPIYLETRFGIHTFFVKSPIIVLIMDNNYTIVRKIMVRPWRICFWNPKYYRVLEVPEDSKAAKAIIGTEVYLESAREKDK